MARKRNGMRRFKKRSYNRKRFYRKRKYHGPSKYVNRSMLVLPDRYFAKLKYCRTQNVTGASPQYFTFNGNSAYDPENATGGGQPVGFDQLIGLYDGFRVRGCKIVVKAIGVSGSHAPTKILIIPTNDGNAITNFDSTECQPYVRSSVTAGYGGPLTVIKNYISTRKILGIKDISNASQYAGSSSANPATLWFWIVAFQLLAGGSITALSVDYQLTYYTEFFDRKVLTDA